MMNDDDDNVAAVLGSVLDASACCDAKVFIVGGKVRDTILAGDATFDTDIDMVVEGDAHTFADEVARQLSATVVGRSKFGTAKVRLLPMRDGDSRRITELDFASSRTETYPHPGAQPTVAPASLREDLNRRDFSINAMAAPVLAFREIACGAAGVGELRGLVIDPCGGLMDLDQRALRILHARSFRDDPTRMLRGLRYRARLHGFFEAGTQSCLDEALAIRALETVSPQRTFAELSRWVAEPLADRLFEAFDWDQMLPEWGVSPQEGVFLSRLFGSAINESAAVKHCLWIRFIQRFVASAVRQKLNVSKAQWREVADLFESRATVDHARICQIWTDAESVG